MWRSIVAQVSADGLVLDARELRWLHDACDEADQLAALMVALADAPLTVLGSQASCSHRSSRASSTRPSADTCATIERHNVAPDSRRFEGVRGFFAAISGSFRLDLGKCSSPVLRLKGIQAGVPFVLTGKLSESCLACRSRPANPVAPGALGRGYLPLSSLDTFIK